MAGEALNVKIGGDISALRAEMQKARGLVQNFTDGVKDVATNLGLAFGAQQVASFTVELIKLSGQADGVRQAFTKLRDSQQVLEDLKSATKGTVSDLDLMKSAVQASNFKIPVQQLGQLFQFAYERAKATGQSVDYLVNSIVTGIGRKSPLILDNLGISAVALKEKLKGVSSEAATIGDVARAVGEIATEELANMGNSATTAAEKIQRISTNIENIKTRAGGVLATIFDPLIEALNLLTGGSGDPIKQFESSVSEANIYSKDLASLWKSIEESAKKAGVNINSFVSQNAGINKILDAYRAAQGGFVGPQQGGFTPQLISVNRKSIDPSIANNNIGAANLAAVGQSLSQILPQLQVQSVQLGQTASQSFNGIYSSLEKLTKSGYFEALHIYWEQQQRDMDNQIQTTYQLSSMIGSSVASAVSGQMTAAQALSNITRAVLDAYEKQALAAIIANSAKTGKNPLLAVGLATAGFAAIKALFAKIGSSGGGSGGGAGQYSGPRNIYENEKQMTVNVVGRVSGRDIVFAYDKNKTLDSVRAAG